MRAILLFVLVMSVIFNLLFSAGFVRARSETKRLQHERETGGAPGIAAPNAAPDVDHGPGRPGPDGRPGDGPRGDGPGRRPDSARMFPRELELDPAQKEVFEQLRQSMREEEAVLDETMAGVRKQLADELQNDEPNIDRLRELIARQGDLMQQRRVGAANRFADFLNVLSPEQTRIMAKHMLRNMPGRGFGGGGGDGGGRPRDGSPGKMPPELMKRLDVDGDGKLNESERMAAQAEFDKHRREWEARRAELRARFDTDKNGELDHDETAQMRQWLLENRRRDGGRGRDGQRGADGHGTPGAAGAPGAPGNFDVDQPGYDGPDSMRPPPNPEDGPGGPGEEPFVPDWW